MKKFLPVFLFLSISLAPYAAEDILIADFEGKDYGAWTAEGEAFGPSPANGTLPGQMEVSGYEGEGLVNSFYNGDNSKGVLTSPSFQIERSYINFLIGGGGYPEETCIDLLVDGKVVRTAVGPNKEPGGSEMLDWHSWDVSEFTGQQAQIQIIDNRAGGWGHINIDQIIQSDTKYKATLEDFQRTIKLTDRYLHFPVKNKGKKRLVKLLIGEQSVREFEIEFAVNEPDFWVFLDGSEFKGKNVILQTQQFRGDPPKLLDSITQGNQIKNAETIYKETLRPQFHFSSKRGWNNDPNGLVYYKGEYHLFYQHNPYGWSWGNMTWGHAVSKDLVHWKELSDAIHPDKLGTIFSGSAIVDKNNTAGFQTGDESPIVCIYTSAGGTNPMSEGQPFTQSIAYSCDRGRTWTKYEGNPIINHIVGGNRDPKVIWHEPTNQWAMALFLDDKEIAFFTSNNLKEWTYHSKIKSFHECPELFELPVDGDPANKKWILYGGSGEYFIGHFDGEKFNPETGVIRFHYGDCFYASQTYNNIPEEDGRRIQIAWGQIPAEGMPFNQMMLFPVSLSLHTTEEGVRMYANPVKEIETLYTGKQTWKNKTLTPGANLLKDVSGELLDIEAEFEIKEDTVFGFKIRDLPIVYDAGKQELQCGKQKAAMKPIDGKLRLRLLVDRTSIEIFANHGQIYMPVKALPSSKDVQSIELFTSDRSVSVPFLEIRHIQTIWQ